MNFKLKIPPLLNAYYGHIARGKRVIKYIKTPGKEFKAYVKDFAHRNQLDVKANIPLKMTIHIYFKDKRKRDIDAILKSLLDSLTEAMVYEDDSLIEELHIYKHAPKPEEPHIDVTIEKL